MSEPTTTPTHHSFLSAAWLVLRRGVRPLLASVIVFRTVLFLVLAPLAVALLNALVRQSGQPAITNNGLLSFALSPLGLATLVVAAVVGLTLTALESAALLLIVLRTLRGQKASARQALFLTGARLPALLGIALLRVLLGLLAALPFVGVAGVTCVLLLSGSDINYYLARKPPAFLVAAGIGAVLAAGLLLVLLLLYLSWLFAVPAVLFEGHTGRNALRASAALTRGHRGRLLGWLLAWQVLRAAVFAVALLGVNRLNVVLLGGSADAGLVLRTVACLLIGGAVLLLLSVLDAVGYTLLLAVLYEDLHRRLGTAITDPLFQQELPLRPTTPLFRVASWVGLTILVGGALGQAALLAGQFAKRMPVMVTAHRAGARKAPENSLAALREAIAEGADFAEIDVQLTADGVVVVLHDRDLRRLTGVARNIRDMKYEDVRPLDAGSWFGPTFKGERIATLEEFIEAARGKIKLNVELKYYGYDEDLAGRVVAILQQHDFLDQATITSLEVRGMEAVRALEPRLRTGYIVSASVGDLTKVDVDFLSVRHALVTPEFRRDAARRGWEVHAWNVNERKDMEAMLDLGVDNLITDDVPLAREVIRRHEDLPVGELILRRLHAWLRS